MITVVNHADSNDSKYSSVYHAPLHGCFRYFISLTPSDTYSVVLPNFVTDTQFQT